MTQGAPQLIVTVVPDSGTDELIGLTGKMSINIADGKHFYEFDYTLNKPRLVFRRVGFDVKVKWPRRYLRTYDF